MKVGIHTELHMQFAEDVAKYEKILAFNAIDCIRLDIDQPDFWEQLKTLDLFIFRWRHIDDHRQLAQTILPVVEQLGIRYFPDHYTGWHFDDKVKQYYLLKEKGFPIIRSWIFWDREKAVEWAESADYPVVFKLKGGAGSSNVLLLENKKAAIQLIRRMFGKGVYSGSIPDSASTRRKFFSLYNELREIKHYLIRKYHKVDTTPYWQIHKNYALFQEFMPGNDYDTRVTVIGDRAFAFRRLNRSGDFRSSGSGKIEYDPKQIDMQFVSKAFEISKAMKFRTMAYDFLYGKNREAVFCEISYTFMDFAVRNCEGYWDPQLNWHPGHFWPQYCQLVDLLNLPELKQPSFE